MNSTRTTRLPRTPRARCSQWCIRLTATISPTIRWCPVPLQSLFAIVFAIVPVLIFTLVLPLIGYKSSARVTQSVFLARFHSDLLTYWLLIGLRHAVDYYRKFQDRELKATQLEARLAGGQL